VEEVAAVEKETSWAKIVETAGKLAEEWRMDGSLAWYRGLPDETFELKSTLHREVEEFLKKLKLQPKPDEQINLLRSTYKTEYRGFRASAWPLLDHGEKTDWGIVFAMQHYGQITRMLDWTESLGCAAYFALSISCDKCHDPKKNAAIWMLDPQALNKQSQGRDGLIALDNPSDMEADEENVFDARLWHPKYLTPGKTVLRTIAVPPDFTNARMTAQKSAFTMSGDSFEPLDKEFPALLKSGRLQKFILRPDMRNEVEAFLRAAGLDAYTFYPDRHGLAVRHKDNGRYRLELMKKHMDKLKA